MYLVTTDYVSLVIAYFRLGPNVSIPSEQGMKFNRTVTIGTVPVSTVFCEPNRNEFSAANQNRW